MSKSKLWWVSVVAASAVVVSVGGTGAYAQLQYAGLQHEEPFHLAEPSDHDLVVPALAPGSQTDTDNTQLAARLAALAEKRQADLGSFGAQVTDATTGEVVWELNPDQALRPASSTKLLTAAAAIMALGGQDRVETTVVRGDKPGTVVIKAAGDVGLTKKQIADLASQLGDGITTVLIDTSVWPGEKMLAGWNEQDIDAGFIAPMEPTMLYGARIGATTGDVPRSHTPALDVAKALAQAVGAKNSGEGVAPADADVLAKTSSDTLAERLHTMMLYSDNVMAEALGREIALSQGKPGTAQGATTATLDILSAHGFDVSGIKINDSSGLSVDNRITPALLNSIIDRAVQDDELRDLLSALPVAGGEGTLEQRFVRESARGLLRAKTGTLTETSALAGTVTGSNNHIYTFGMLSNGAEVESQRAALDALASTLRDAE
ncbi:D-alanyl-D-alanine carboxypeptidase/D-alanyl-D-alanine-endopeptidase [Corynebacterium sp. 3HC-13]|uniref:D-alanyl-D-alanine carboxypeptidase/D-alanyl-D-alanine endopeptidase n=1 Tax=Corynebacterium poyangense TaxID=2684405 RepID=UPI001CCC261A|nr:D-alanyl-D-alanine carboxypeptidase/D-alanyl-D-alanine-endopeptidase [Corynebacterium poyangense]MBZ8176480.1 D-alanyl-D-alanine carboxypeptidase/D-alanyl-D-alanine-endopeptidase [Corynebacterium poyangense]